MGKRTSSRGRKVAHCGDLYSYFENDTSIVKRFLENFVGLFSDSTTRKMVLEVNSGNEDLLSITTDLIVAGVKFFNKGLARQMTWQPFQSEIVSPTEW